MTTIAKVEADIFKVEGFKVTIRWPKTKRNVRDDKQKTPGYPYDRMARNEWTVADWRTVRFQRHYPGYDVDVLKPDGTKSKGKLSLLRQAYAKNEQG